MPVYIAQTGACPGVSVLERQALCEVVVCDVWWQRVGAWPGEGRLRWLSSAGPRRPLLPGWLAIPPSATHRHIFHRLLFLEQAQKEPGSPQGQPAWASTCVHGWGRSNEKQGPLQAQAL
jgi:hypothetical protein